MPELPDGRPPPPPRPRPWALAFTQIPKMNNERRPRQSNLFECLDSITYLQVFLDFNVKGEIFKPNHRTLRPWRGVVWRGAALILRGLI
jgi:hypothetical protein